VYVRTLNDFSSVSIVEWSVDETARKQAVQRTVASSSNAGKGAPGRSKFGRTDAGGVGGADHVTMSMDMSDAVNLNIPFEAHAYEAILTTVNTLHRY
jgi:hypothetical protein